MSENKNMIWSEKKQAHIPKEKIVNGAKMIWYEPDEDYIPEIIKDENNGLTYLLDQRDWSYNPMVCYTNNTEEQELLKEQIGFYGRRWIEFMEQNYPLDIMDLKGMCRWEIIPREIDKEADEMYQILSKQFEQNNPRPTESFVEIAKWEKMKQTEIRQAIMEDIVLKPRQ